ncbi:MAG: cupin domain-containing protein [Rhodobacteraceae bacterium]|nr:cupin domain-containing protein [Paracoccaceae bacterium]
MTSLTHHLTEDLLMAYAAGNLPEAFSLVVATHISLCDDCRAALAALECVGGNLLEECAPSPLADDALARALARIADAPGPIARPAIPAPVRRGVLPAPLQGYVGGDLEAVRWRPAGPGVRQAILPVGDGATARLLHIRGGQSVPDHGHRGMELTLVLQGAFRDGAARFARGDIEIVAEEVEHCPVAEEGEDCICLAATDAPLRFRGMLPRLAQPFLQI